MQFWKERFVILAELGIMIGLSLTTKRLLILLGASWVWSPPCQSGHLGPGIYRHCPAYLWNLKPVIISCQVHQLVCCVDDDDDVWGVSSRESNGPSLMLCCGRHFHFNRCFMDFPTDNGDLVNLLLSNVRADLKGIAEFSVIFIFFWTFLLLPSG